VVSIAIINLLSESKMSKLFIYFSNEIFLVLDSHTLFKSGAKVVSDTQYEDWPLP